MILECWQIVLQCFPVVVEFVGVIEVRNSAEIRVSVRNQKLRLIHGLIWGPRSIHGSIEGWFREQKASGSISRSIQSHAVTNRRPLDRSVDRSKLFLANRKVFDRSLDRLTRLDRSADRSRLSPEHSSSLDRSMDRSNREQSTQFSLDWLGSSVSTKKLSRSASSS